MAVRRSCVALAAALVLAGCGYGPTGPDPAEASALLDARSREVAAGWTRTLRTASPYGLLPLQQLTVAPAGIPQRLVELVDGGAYALRTELPMGELEPGVVRFADGASQSVPLVTAHEAFTAIKLSGCTADRPEVSPDEPKPSAQACVVLPVTAVRLGEAPLYTSRGPATAPAWLFTVPGLPGPVVRMAVAADPAGSEPVPGLAEIDPRLLTVVAPLLGIDAVDGRSVRFWYDKACDTVVGPVAYESEHAVVLSVQVEPPPRHSACPHVQVARQASLVLDVPLGSRQLLEVRGGLVRYLTPRESERLSESGP